jgi:hypothetical protein
MEKGKELRPSLLGIARLLSQYTQNKRPLHEARLFYQNKISAPCKGLMMFVLQ